MNQILSDKKENSFKLLKTYKFLLFISIILCFCFSCYLTYYIYNIKNNESSSYSLLNTFNIERLYSNNINYTNIELNSNTSFIIGSIEIPKINIKYPIISNTTDELLKISPCRFYGSYPNQIGNLCIAAHNYDDNRFFSNLYKLDMGDTIKIHDLNNVIINYYVYDKFEIKSNNTDCTSQNTKGKREITLVTCNNINKNRIVIKAKE